MNDQRPMTNDQRLNIGWLYPDLMSTYGDRGNILVLQKRCELRGIKTKIIQIVNSTTSHELRAIDLLFGGGSQDREQDMVMNDLKGKKEDMLKKLIEKNIPALFVCGAPQLMGKYYEPAIGKRIEGLGIFDMVTENPGLNAPRCIGNIIAAVEWQNLTSDQRPTTSDYIVGFENHGGRTYLGKNAKPFARIIKGNGNNGKDGTEGVVYKNAIGCYFHGPLLPKNPHVADFLIKRALEVKYEQQMVLKELDDTIEKQAAQVMLAKLGIKGHK